jgi:hypothetical protein
MGLLSVELAKDKFQIIFSHQSLLTSQIVLFVGIIKRKLYEQNPHTVEKLKEAIIIFTPNISQFHL